MRKPQGSKTTTTTTFSKIKVVNATSALINGSPLASYPFECELDSDFLTNLSLRVNLGGGSAEGGPSAVTDITDDLKLESYFMQQALACVVAGRSRLEACGRIWNRPPTYHAHMLKTVAHLQRINRAEEADRKQRDAIIDARRQRLLKSTAKKVQQDTLQERQKTRTAERKQIEEIKKSKGKDEGGSDDFNVEAVVDDMIRGSKTGKKKPLPLPTKKNNSNRFKGASSANPKRQAKDKKFGFGGLDRKMTKKNTKDSVNDLSGFAKSNTKTPFGGRVQKNNKNSRGGGSRGGSNRGRGRGGKR
jgi:hypothetical protein